MLKSAVEDGIGTIFIVLVIILLGSITTALSQVSSNLETKDAIISIGNIGINSILLISAIFGILSIIGLVVTAIYYFQNNSGGRT